VDVPGLLLAGELVLPPDDLGLLGRVGERRRAGQFVGALGRASGSC
jgi:hypothetical protein